MNKINSTQKPWHSKNITLEMISVRFERVRRKKKVLGGSKDGGWEKENAVHGDDREKWNNITWTWNSHSILWDASEAEKIIWIFVWDSNRIDCSVWVYKFINLCNSESIWTQEHHWWQNTRTPLIAVGNTYHRMIHFQLKIYFSTESFSLPGMIGKENIGLLHSCSKEGVCKCNK